MTARGGQADRLMADYTIHHKNTLTIIFIVAHVPSNCPRESTPPLLRFPIRVLMVGKS